MKKSNKKKDKIDLRPYLYQAQLLQFKAKHCNLIIDYSPIQGVLTICFGNHNDAPMCFFNVNKTISDLEYELDKLRFLYSKYENK